MANFNWNRSPGLASEPARDENRTLSEGVGNMKERCPAAQPGIYSSARGVQLSTLQNIPRRAGGGGRDSRQRNPVRREIRVPRVGDVLAECLERRLACESKREGSIKRQGP